ncbi:hypothetical protein H6F96_21300 [Microcoleus sp. FACHB-53]|nr:hypothetical protein [Microcoleus sp. FACHB-53]
MAFHLLCRHCGCFHSTGCLEFDAVAVYFKVRSRPLILGDRKERFSTLRYVHVAAYTSP